MKTKNVGGRPRLPAHMLKQRIFVQAWFVYLVNKASQETGKTVSEVLRQICARTGWSPGAAYCSWCDKVKDARNYVCDECAASFDRLQIIPCFCLATGAVYQIKDAQGAVGGPSHGYSLGNEPDFC